MKTCELCFNPITSREVDITVLLGRGPKHLGIHVVHKRCFKVLAEYLDYAGALEKAIKRLGKKNK